MRSTGLAAWWVQRLSAAYMLVFVIFLLTRFAIDPVHGYAQWLGWVGRPSTGVALATFFAALLSHMWVGLRDVLLDYAKPPALQRLLERFQVPRPRIVEQTRQRVQETSSLVWELV